MANIFLLEDDRILSKGISIALKKDGHHITTAYGYVEALQKYTLKKYDLFLLDINLPDGNGMNFCQKVRQTSQLPVLFLTANDTEEDMLNGYDAGCDDYISKPYNAQVLLARIQKLLARTYEIQDNVVLTHKGLTLNLLKAEISYQGQRKSLTKNEMGILRLLMVNKENIIPRDAIIDELWQSEQFIDENTLNVNIVRLRKTLAEIGLPDYLETKRGLGYCV